MYMCFCAARVQVSTVKNSCGDDNAAAVRDAVRLAMTSKTRRPGTRFISLYALIHTVYIMYTYAHLHAHHGIVVVVWWLRKTSGPQEQQFVVCGIQLRFIWCVYVCVRECFDQLRRPRFRALGGRQRDKERNGEILFL